RAVHTLPPHCVVGAPPPFLIRVALAATLSPVYGIYSGFELCESTPVPGKEEYLDSEKYHFQGRNWMRRETSRSTSPSSTPSARKTARFTSTTIFAFITRKT